MVKFTISVGGRMEGVGRMRVKCVIFSKKYERKK